MGHNFGRHVAGEVLTTARTFLDHAHDPACWPSLSNPVRGRMTPAALARGEKLHAAAAAGMAGSASHAGDLHAPAFAIDQADHAASDWLHDQLAQARGLLHEENDDAALAALDAALTSGEGRPALSANVRAYVKLVEAKDATGEALSASYLDKRSRDAILKDGLHLADALDALLGATAAARGTRGDATAGKDDAVGALARWLHRWSLVAHRVVGPAGLAKLGLGSARHHPAHRAQHPAAPEPPAPTSPTS